MAAAASGGVQPLKVSIQITTAGAKQAANSMQQVTKASAGMSRGFGNGIITARTLGDAMRMSATLMKYTVAGAFMSAGKAAIQAYRNFELSFSRIRGLVGISADAISEMKDGVLEMATETTRGPEELAEALYFITSAGLRDASLAMDVLRASARAAASGLGDTKTVADAVTSSLNAYGATTITAARATDVITAAVREGKAEADTMAPAFSKVLPVAAAYGASFEDVAAAMAALSRSGMTAGTAAIYVRQTLSQLLKPSKQGRDALSAVGTSAEEIRANVRDKGLFQALQILSTQLGGIEKAADFAKVFGNVRALTAVLQLVGPAASENAEIFERLQNSAGDSADAFSAYEDTLDAKFNQAFAASRVALIEFGEALKPTVTLLLEIATAFSQVAKFFLGIEVAGIPVVKMFLSLGSVVILAVVALSSMMKTMSGIIRLGANLNIVLRGTQLMYDATTGSVMRLTAAQVKQMQAQAAANGTTAALIPVTTGAGKAVGMLSGAIGKLTLALGLITIAFSIFQYFKNKANEAAESTDSLAESMANVNEILDETVKYGKSNLFFDVNMAIDNSRIAQNMERAKEQILEQAPDFFDNTSKALAAMGQDNKAAYIQALLTGPFGGVSSGVKEVLQGLFAKEFGIDPQLIADAVVPVTTGDAVADSLIFAAVQGAKSASEAAAAAIGGDTFDDFNQAIRNAMEEAERLKKEGYAGDLEIFGKPTIDALKEFGRAFTDGIQESEGQIGPLIIALQEMEKAGTLNASTLRLVLGTSLQGLTGLFDLQSESAGNLAEMFSKTGNEAALVAMIMKMTNKGNEEATVIYEGLRQQLDAIPDGPNQSVEAFRIFNTVVADATVLTDGMSEATRQQISELDGQQAALKGVIEIYEEQTDVIKELEKAQRGLLGINLTQEESLRDLMDQYQGFGDAVAKSKGSFDISTEGGRAARAELQANAEAVFDLANAYAAQGDMKGAGEVISTGLANIASVAAQAGGEMAGIEAANLLESMGFTAQNFSDSLLAAEKSVDASALNTGKAVVDGIARGISTNQSSMSQALVDALNGVMVVAKDSIESKSPSKKFAREVGMPMGQGVEVGFTKYASSAKFKRSITNTLDKSVTAAYKAGGRAGVSKFFTDFLDRKKSVETPAQDFVKATIGRMKDIIGSLGDYIKSQLNFRKAQSELAKLINMQRGLDDRRRKAAREQQYATTRFGMGGGAEVTGYEQAQIDQLQLDFERVSRDYAMGRASYIELVDAEIALYEARAAASEINDDVINSQNDFIDASVDVENAELDLADATVNVLESYQDVQEAAAELYMNHKELADVYNNLAKATGIASGKIQIGKTDLTNLGKEVEELGGFASTVGGYMSTLGNNMSITGQNFRSEFDGPNGIFSKIAKTGGNITSLTNSIGARFTDLSKGLLDPDAQFTKDLQSLGPAIFRAIKIGAQEALDASPLNLKISVNAQVDSSGSGSVSWKVNVPQSTTRPPTLKEIFEEKNVNKVVAPNNRTIIPGFDYRAVGGPVSGLNPYMVGERGPEMFIPKVSGTIVTNNALERYARTRNTGATQQREATGNSINVVVNNPVPQAAEESITRRMKVLANSGLFG